MLTTSIACNITPFFPVYTSLPRPHCIHLQHINIPISSTSSKSCAGGCKQDCISSPDAETNTFDDIRSFNEYSANSKTTGCTQHTLECDIHSHLFDRWECLRAIVGGYERCAATEFCKTGPRSCPLTRLQERQDIYLRRYGR